MTEKELNKPETQDEKELDSIFDNQIDTKFKKAIKKAKWHSILKNAVISLLVLGVAIIGGSIANSGLVYRLEGPVQIAEDSFNEISAPNQYIGKVSRYHEILGGRNEYTTYKIIEGKILYSGRGDYSYGFLRNEWDNKIGTESPLILGTSYDAGDLKIQKYNELGQREMIFFYPFISYPEYKNDLQLLASIGSNKIMEMALSFDREYTLDEIKNLLPQDVTLAWYWVDDLDEQEKEASKARKEQQQDSDGKTYEMEYPARIRSEKTVYGIKAYNHNGEPLQDPAQNFAFTLQKGRKYDTSLKGEFERVYQNIAGQDDKLTKEDIKVLGVVVTGEGKNLNGLRGLSFIKASSLGVVTDKY